MYEVFNYITGETIGYTDTEDKAIRRIRRASRQAGQPGLFWDYINSDEQASNYCPTF